MGGLVCSAHPNLWEERGGSASLESNTQDPGGCCPQLRLVQPRSTWDLLA